jgi:murein DD-endopeptidase MepM/ murein hydrolase activator NlpD
VDHRTLRIVTRLVLAACSLSLVGLVGLVGAAASPAAVRSAPVAAYSWPLLPGPDVITSNFDPPSQPWLAGNRGVDLAGRPAKSVHASQPGLVTFAGQIAGIGVVAVTDGALRTTYEPLQVTVQRGERVTAGQVIGRLSVKGSHCAPRACLHWGLLRGSDYLDPLALLGLEQVRLLPLEDRTES